ncbi:MAG: xanthine dehydrogenase family protein molybdopterin-binding subunit [Acidobacteria bacterium]|nr:xanthine dehydrogenase family protein molybdopterin-binding subunit [Acidobacteriota bacterium]
MSTNIKTRIDLGDRLDDPTPDPYSSVSGFSRRDFLKGTGLLIVSFSMSGGIAKTAGASAEMECGAGVSSGVSLLTDIPIDQVDSYLAIATNGSVTVFTGRIDMGTGLFTSFSQFVADELDVAIERITVIGGDTDLTPDGGKTTGSDGVRVGGQPLIVSAATARQKLLELAAERFGVPVGLLTVSNGVVSVKSDPSKKVSYGELIGDGRFSIKLEVDRITLSGPLLKIPAGVSLKTPSQYNYVGKSIPRFDVLDRLINATFCQNVRLPGMLHGRLVRPAGLGSTLVSVDESSVKNLPGFVKLVVKGNFVGVVCEREEQAIQAQEKLKVTWSDWAGLPGHENVFNDVRSQPPETRIANPNPTRVQGDVDAAMGSASKILKATYECPWSAHTMLGPSCAVADVQTDKATIWSGTQWPRYTQKDIAFLLELPTESVRVIWVEESGSYGRLAAADAAADAALLSQAVGKPVRVQWTRAEEHAWAPHQPLGVNDFRAGLNAEGKIVAWDVEAWTSSTHDTGRGGGLLAMRLIGKDPGPKVTLSASAPGSGHYVFPNVRGAGHTVKPLLRAIYMRSPSSFANNFAYESFMDELAAAARIDPVEFRLRHLTNSRLIAVVNAAAAKAGWQTRPSPKPDADSTARFATGRGLAIQLQSGASVATVVEVEVDRETGKVRVKRVVVAFETGIIVNPDGLLNQVEQATLQGISRALMEEVQFDKSNVTSVDWVSHPILKFSEIPTVEVQLINRPDLPPEGAGEPGTTPPTAAIGNAIFDATGVRIRRKPFTPERVLAALKQQ